MEMDMLHSAGSALLIILDPIRLLYLFGGVCMGLSLGILPGIGGVAGLALLLPFTYSIDAAAAFALLLGMGSTTTTADPISAILFGAPGHAASAATADATSGRSTRVALRSGCAVRIGLTNVP